MTGQDPYQAIKTRIDRELAGQPEDELEIGKAAILADSEPYCAFLARNTPGRDVAAVRRAVLECGEYVRAHPDVRASLRQLAGDRVFQPGTGEVRVHAYTLFVFVRLYRPKVVVETGVANGKSSMFILAALEQEGAGHLVSVDLPTILSNGADKHKREGRQAGWMVPDRLRARWSLHLEDAVGFLEKMQGGSAAKPDLIFLDSFKQYDFSMREYAAAFALAQPGGVVLVDNCEMSDAFPSWQRRLGDAADEFGTFGVMRKAAVGD
jgi:predicted O-methyltransferase YrrM